MPDEPLFLKAVSLDISRTSDGEPVALLGMITEEAHGDAIVEYAISREGAEAIIKSLTNFIDVCEGRPISYPTPQ